MCPKAISAPGSNDITWRVGTTHIRKWTRPTAALTDSPTTTKARRVFSSPSCATPAGFALHAGLPGGCYVYHARRRGAGGREVLPGLPLLHSGLSIWLPLLESQEEYRRQVHALLPPHHTGSDHGLLRSLSDQRKGAGRFEKSERSGSRILAHSQRAGAEAANGDGRQGVLQEPGRSGPVRRKTHA